MIALAKAEKHKEVGHIHNGGDGSSIFGGGVL